MIVGDASPSGWDVNNPVAFKQDLTNPLFFTLECSLNEGNFKLLTGTKGDWCGEWYRPLVDNQDFVCYRCRAKLRAVQMITNGKLHPGKRRQI